MWTSPPSPTNNIGVFSFPLPSFANFLWHPLLCLRLAKSLFLGPRKLIFTKLLRLLLGWIFSKHGPVVSMRKRLKSERPPAYNSPVLCPSPYACTQPNRPRIMAALDNCLDLVNSYAVCDGYAMLMKPAKGKGCHSMETILWLNPCVRLWCVSLRGVFCAQFLFLVIV